MTANEYVDRVLDCMPRETPMREQIAMELRALIEERMRGGRSIAEVIAQLGDPEKLAESYLAAVPLERVSFDTRAAAKSIDIAMSIVVAVPIATAVLWLCVPNHQFTWILACGASLVCACPILMVYTIVAERQVDRTMGKRMMDILVVQETGTRIGVGQAIVRQLPWMLQVFWIDAFFALFTDRHQRAFELLSKTRVVQQPTPEVNR